jgi:protoheme IX farnesyltransferase
MLRAYYQLTKPGIIYGNLVSLLAGYFFAASLHMHFPIDAFICVVIGTGLVIGSACVFNNVMDRRIDKHMARTKKRALVTGIIPVTAALLYGAVLGASGFAILAYGTNMATVWVGLVGFFDYLVLYAISKRHSVWGTIIGSIAGATPIVAGYTAITGDFDRAAQILFAIMAVWQMPHFYSISLYRYEDYKAAGLPVWPIKKGTYSTKVQMVLFITAYIAACWALTAYGYTGYVYAAVMVGAGGAWLWRCVQGFAVKDEKGTIRWARKMFGTSLLVLLVFCAAASVGSFLP